MAYARRVKNARLVLLARGEIPGDFLRFLRRKHRYREVAVVEEGRYRGTCFKTFEPPFSPDLPIKDALLSKALTASLLLLSPLLLLQREEELENMLV